MEVLNIDENIKEKLMKLIFINIIHIKTDVKNEFSKSENGK